MMNNQTIFYAPFLKECRKLEQNCIDKARYAESVVKYVIPIDYHAVDNPSHAYISPASLELQTWSASLRISLLV
jgi:hypothetical protein